MRVRKYLELFVDVGFIGPRTSEERLSPILAACCVRWCRLVMVLSWTKPLQVSVALFLVIYLGSGGSRPCFDIMEIVLGVHIRVSGAIPAALAGEPGIFGCCFGAIAVRSVSGGGVSSEKGVD